MCRQGLADQHGTVAPHWDRRLVVTPQQRLLCTRMILPVHPHHLLPKLVPAFLSVCSLTFVTLCAGYAVATFLCIPLGELVLRRMM